MRVCNETPRQEKKENAMKERAKASARAERRGKNHNTRIKKLYIEINRSDEKKDVYWFLFG